MGTNSLDRKETKKNTASIFERNLAYMLERIAGENAEQTLQMLMQELPQIRVSISCVPWPVPRQWLQGIEARTDAEHRRSRGLNR